MATRFVFSDTADGYVQCSNADYATARSGAGSRVQNSVDDTLYVGQQFTGSTYVVSQLFIQFDLSSVGSISSVTFSARMENDFSTTDFTINVRSYDWGGTVSTADFIDGSLLSANTLLATFDTSTTALNSYQNFVDSALLANVASTYRMMMCSSRTESNTTPTGNEYMGITSRNNTTAYAGPCRLTVVDDSTQSSTTINTGTTSFTPSVVGLHDVDLFGGGARPTLASSQEGSGGGSSYAFYTLTVGSLSSITVSVAAQQNTAATAGNDTTWDTGPVARAKGGVASGAASNSGNLGVIRFSGSNATAAQGGGGSRGGSGGGSSGSAAGNGVAGSAGSGSAGGAGGIAPSGGGNGGAGGASGVAGSSGTVPGGGAGGGGNGADAGNGAAGRIIVYWYTPAVGRRQQPIIRSNAMQRAARW